MVMSKNFSVEKVKRGFEFVFSLPKSFFVSWKLTSFRECFKLPILVRYNVKLLSLEGQVRGNGRISIGFNRTNLFDVRHQRTMISICGTIIISGLLLVR